MRARSVLASCLVAAALASAPGLSRAQAPGAAAGKAPSEAAQREARERYERGQQLAAEGNYEVAMVEFQRAYDLAPSHIILYNIALIHAELRDYAASLRVYRRYLDEGGDRVPAARRSAVQKEMERLQARVGTLEIRTNVPDADILVDDLPMGKTPLASPILVNAGRRKVTATKGGHVTATKIIVVAGTDKISIDLELVNPGATPAQPPSARPAPAPPPERPAPPPAPQMRPGLWAGWVVTGALAAGAAAVGILTLSASRDLRDSRDTFGVTQATLDEKGTKARNLAIVTDVLVGSAVVAAGVSLYFTLTPRVPPGAGPKRSGAFQLRLGPASIGAAGTF